MNVQMEEIIVNLEWIQQLVQTIRWTDLSISIGILIVFLLLRKFLTHVLLNWINKRWIKSERANKWSSAFEKPLSLFILAIGVYLSIHYFMHDHVLFMSSINRIFRSVTVIIIGWGVFNLSASSSFLLGSISKRLGIDDSSMLIPFLSKVMRLVIIVLIITIVSGEWGYSINGLVAGLGLGSLAIALAAKDTLGNILGGVVIILEKPFSKGDWIMSPSTEGIVEDITFRSSKIRTFADSIVTVPNATLANEPITNWSRMGKRRITFNLGVALNSNRERLATALSRIEDELRHHDDIDPGTIMVRFNEFNESSLGIFFYFFTKTTVWAEYLAVRQNINLMILQILEEEGVRLAYPTNRVYVEQEEQVQGKYYSN